MKNALAEKPRKKTFNIAVPLSNKFRACCIARDLKPSEEIERLVAEWIEKNGWPEKKAKKSVK